MAVPSSTNGALSHLSKSISRKHARKGTYATIDVGLWQTQLLLFLEQNKMKLLHERVFFLSPKGK